MLVPGLYEDLTILHQNTIPSHAYFIPASGQDKTPSAPQLRLSSDRLQMLSGCDWDFRYYRSIYDLNEEFYQTGYQPGSGWQQETVPFCWQMKGYDENQYTNIRYPFPFDPPFVPQHNPCGAYLHTFLWHPEPDAPCTFLHFEGVDSCFYVWLNGTYVGYSQVTHRTSEFDVSALLVEGENRLAVLVLKWCDGSYLEDQDKFRMSGIIRDVYLIRRPKNHISDYVITTDLSEDLSTAKLTVKFFFSKEPVPVRLRLFFEAEKPAVSDEGSAFRACPEEVVFKDCPGGICEASLTVDHPLLWNAETPNLYTLILETEHETIRERVGFRHVSVENGVLMLNGCPIKFRGVNRHESDPVTGSVVSPDQVIRDLCMIREHNFNAIRASHYPNVPYFYQLCDELGLYVIDEADNESHGTAPLYFTENDYSERMRLAHERIADNPAFLEATLDRVSSMVLQNRNRPSVLVWSMGNECGYGCTFEEALRWTKNTDPTRLTHYESAYYLPGDREYDVSNIDLFGRMYPAFEEVTDYLEKDPAKPLLLVEYCHSMGNSPGDFEKYRDLTEQYPRLCGGFVWEWCDHAVYKGRAENGKDIYWYGGDHQELQHDGNFCLDGLVYPDRTPHTGLLEYKNVHRPLRAVYDEKEGLLTITNYWDFVSASSCVTALYRLTLDGKEIQAGSFPLPDILPHTSAAVPLKLTIPPKGRCFLTITYLWERELTHTVKLQQPLPDCSKTQEDTTGYSKTREDTTGCAQTREGTTGRAEMWDGTIGSSQAHRIFPCLPQGHVLGFDDIRMVNEDGRNQEIPALLFRGEDSCSNSVEISEDGTELSITGSDFVCRLDLLSGHVTSFRSAGKEILKKPVSFNLWRAPTDNDQKPADLWKWERLDLTSSRAFDTAWETRDGSAVIRLRQSVAAISVQPVLRVITEYRISPDGTIRMEFSAKKDSQIETLPRIGLRMFLDGSLDQAEYYGIGPYESYADKHHCGRHDLFRTSLKDLHEDYIRPQENGSHCDCDYVRLTGGDLSVIAASADRSTFSFNASVFTQEELETKRHNYELEPCGDTVLCIDHRMAGIGSASCGPALSPEYRVDADEYQFAFLIQFQNAGRKC